MHHKKTKIVCTLGPSSDSVSEITRLIQGGMNIARLNFSHGTYSHHGKILKSLRTVEKKSGRHIAVLQDLQGAKIRIGKIPDKGFEVKNQDTLILSTTKTSGKKSAHGITVPIDYHRITKEVKKGHDVLINDGLIEAKVEKVTPREVICRVRAGGIIKSRNGVNFPDSSISLKPITDKDKEDLKFGLKNKVDFIAMSFVKSAKDIATLRKLIHKEHKNTPIIAKIERHEAVKNLKEIIKAADGVMIARGDLGIDVPPEQVPIIQKSIIALANSLGRPVITATHVLQSMVENPRATRAEISDAANAVFDRTDAIMLSNESAIGRYPARATATLSRVATSVEKELQKHKDLLQYFSTQKPSSTLNATCLSASELAIDTKADFIIAYTMDGYTARQIARHRIYIPIITITPSEKVARELTLVWGLNQIFTHKISEKSGSKTEKILEFLKKNNIVKKGQKIVIVCNASRKEKVISTFKV